jgi:hypothetical protein
MLKFSEYKDKISKSVHYHIENNIPFAENIYRVHSEEFYRLFREARELFKEGALVDLTEWDKTLLETDIGEFGEYEGQKVPLDCPIQEEDKKDPPLNKPKRGGPKKFYVFVRDGDKIKKVTWGDTTGLSVKLKILRQENLLQLGTDVTSKKIKQKLHIGLVICRDMQRV